MRIYLASDHAGFELKNDLVLFLKGLGHDVEDCGPASFDKDDDYPPLIAKAAKQLSEDVAAGRDSRAIVLGGSGQGEAMVANRFKGVRCALYYGAGGMQIDMSGHTIDILVSNRSHNDSNALSIGARFVHSDEAKKAVESWLSTPFSGEERHVRRIKQIDEISSQS